MMSRDETIAKLDQILDSHVMRTTAALVDAVDRGVFEPEEAADQFAVFVRDLEAFRLQTIAEVVDRASAQS